LYDHGGSRILILSCNLSSTKRLIFLFFLLLVPLTACFVLVEITYLQIFVIFTWYLIVNVMAGDISLTQWMNSVGSIPKFGKIENLLHG
jgi:hypothetical protein